MERETAVYLVPTAAVNGDSFLDVTGPELASA